MKSKKAKAPEVELCNEAAPLALNGGAFVGCAQLKGHAGQHQVSLRWGPQ